MSMIFHIVLIMLLNTDDMQSKRELLLFANNKSDTMLIQQQKIFSTDLEGMKERDLVIKLFTNAQEKNGKGKNLQTKYNPEMKPYLLVLIGKDGGEKFRSDKPVSTAELFAIIDAMPMRQAEQRRQRNE